MIIGRASLMALAILFCQPAFADEAGYVRQHRSSHIAASRHVVEVVIPPYSGRFVINGYRYDGLEPACHAWYPLNRSGLFQVVGMVIASTLHFTTHRYAALATQFASGAHGGDRFRKE
jgi:hypothetical protein